MSRKLTIFTNIKAEITLEIATEMQVRWPGHQFEIAETLPSFFSIRNTNFPRTSIFYCPMKSDINSSQSVTLLCKTGAFFSYLFDLTDTCHREIMESVTITGD